MPDQLDPKDCTFALGADYNSPYDVDTLIFLASLFTVAGKPATFSALPTASLVLRSLETPSQGCSLYCRCIIPSHLPSTSLPLTRPRPLEATFPSLFSIISSSKPRMSLQREFQTYAETPISKLLPHILPLYSIPTLTPISPH
jgi:hypothetical protein